MYERLFLNVNPVVSNGLRHRVWRTQEHSQQNSTKKHLSDEQSNSIVSRASRSICDCCPPKKNEDEIKKTPHVPIKDPIPTSEIMNRDGDPGDESSFLASNEIKETIAHCLEPVVRHPLFVPTATIAATTIIEECNFHWSINSLASTLRHQSIAHVTPHMFSMVGSILNKDQRSSSQVFIEPNGNGILMGNVQLTKEVSFKHLLVCGPTGSGKTSRIIIPNLLHLKDCSILVTDIGAELSSKTAQRMLNRGFSVKVLDLLDPAQTVDTFNPLDVLTPDNDDQLEQFLDTCLINYEAGRKKEDPYFYSGAKIILKLNLLILLENKSKNVLVTPFDFYRRVCGFTYEKYKNLDPLRCSELVWECAQSTMLSEKAFESCSLIAKWSISGLGSRQLRALISTTSVNFAEFRDTPTVLYLKISEDQVHNSKYNLILSLFYSQFFYFCNNRSASNEKPIYCLMDEFGHTPLPNAESILTTIRKKEVSILAAVQSLSQLKFLYGDKADILIEGGFSSQLYIGGVADDQKANSLGRRSDNELSFSELTSSGNDKSIFAASGYKPIKIELPPCYVSSQPYEFNKLSIKTNSLTPFSLQKFSEKIEEPEKSDLINYIKTMNSPSSELKNLIECVEFLLKNTSVLRKDTAKSTEINKWIRSSTPLFERIVYMKTMVPEDLNKDFEFLGHYFNTDMMSLPNDRMRGLFLVFMSDFLTEFALEENSGLDNFCRGKFGQICKNIPFQESIGKLVFLFKKEWVIEMDENTDSVRIITLRCMDDRKMVVLSKTDDSVNIFNLERVT